jgi:serine/threonine protein kinase
MSYVPLGRSLGVMLHMMLTGTQLYQGVNDAAFKCLALGHARELLLRQSRVWGLGLSSSARQLITAMLHPDPSARITVKDIWQHE